MAIPEKEIPQTLIDIFDRSNKFVFLGIDTSPAQAVLSNGENAHCTLKSLKWWVDMVKEHGKKVYTHVMTNGQDSGYEILNDENLLSKPFAVSTGSSSTYDGFWLSDLSDLRIFVSLDIFWF